ncbi:MAG: hypothetical protein ACRCYU_13475 [Nocardioides sp.]
MTNPPNGPDADPAGPDDTARDQATGTTGATLPEMRGPDAREWASRALGHGLTQPDTRSCGAATLVFSRMMHDAAYAQLIAIGRHPITGWEIAGDTTTRFQSETIGMHRRATRIVTINARLQIPWPRALGTPPWALAAQMSGPHGSGAGGDYHVRPAPLWDRGDVYDEIFVALSDDHTIPMVVGDRWLPRHVVLAIAGTADFLRVYDPATGQVQTINRSEFTGAHLPFGRWHRCWATVVPK